MNGKINILIYPLWYEEEWNQGRTYQKVAEHLAKRPDVRKVICVFPKREPKAPYSWPIKIIKESPKLTLLSTFTQCVPTNTAPFRLRRWVNKHIDQLCRLYLHLQGFGEKNTIRWYFPPLTETPQLNDIYPACMTVSQIVDNFLVADTKSPLYTAAHEQYPLLANRSNLIITGSNPMFEYFSQLNSNTCLMENATDDAFIAPCTELPCKSGTQKPRLGYIGFISNRTDLDLLSAIARHYPQYQLIIAGPLHDVTEEQFLSLSSLPNVNHLGPIAYNLLPDLISSFDICLLPHKDTPLSRSMSPLKFFQYLGSGRPIVSTKIGGINRFSQHTYIAENTDEFIQMIDTALTTRTKEKSQQQIEAAKLETWDTRIEIVFNQVQLHLQKNNQIK